MCHIYNEGNEGLEMSALKNAIPGHDFVDFQNKEARKTWLSKAKEGTSILHQHLVSQVDELHISSVAGMEFRHMIYLYPICLKCPFEFKFPIDITRAIESLLLVGYEKQNCPKHCETDNYPSLKWNNESKIWELEYGITKDQLPEESRKTLDASLTLNARRKATPRKSTRATTSKSRVN